MRLGCTPAPAGQFIAVQPSRMALLMPDIIHLCQICLNYITVYSTDGTAARDGWYGGFGLHGGSGRMARRLRVARRLGSGGTAVS